MDFDEFWIRLAMKIGCGSTFKTLVYPSEFKAIMKEPGEVVVTPRSSGDPRVAYKKDFRQMWGIMKNNIRSERYVNRDGRYDDFWCMSYINKLIDHIVGDQDMQ